MEPALPSPLRLRLEHAPTPASHEDVSASIQVFLAAYAARTGAQTSTTDDPAAATGVGAGGSAASTGGVVASQLTRLMNGLAGRIDYDAFAQLISGLNNPAPSIPKLEDDDEEMDVRSVTEFSPPASAIAPQSQAQGADDGELSFSRNDEQINNQDADPHSIATTSDLEIPPHTTKKDRKTDKKHKKIKKEKRTD